MRFIFRIIFIPICFFGISCEPGDGALIDLPELKTKYVVESYLMPGESPRFLITHTDGFIKDYDINSQDNDISTEMVEGVVGALYINGESHEVVNKHLEYEGKFYNYQVSGVDSLGQNDVLELELTFPTGEKVYSKSRVPELIEIDSIAFNKSENRYGDVLYITFDKPETQYVRRILLRVRGKYTQLIQDLPVSGSLSNNGKMVFGSEMDFRRGDTVISRIYSINKEYYDYYNSIFMNLQSNTNPFVQPGQISGNIVGSDKVVGIFTAMQMADSLVVVK
ncbi:DUF4249 family protein [Membranihabitans maritimus]|uniref:DUF4249 family protein n=1 Tax=Membranihabitans maritimus TaxID=2904244 RepID=UPI001F314F6E|nr:DUF4249 family protein [Membranihabitans maritimus]